jgi:hypothetical protein
MAMALVLEHRKWAGVSELADDGDSKSPGATPRAGSNPAPGTKNMKSAEASRPPRFLLFLPSISRP